MIVGRPVRTASLVALFARLSHTMFRVALVVTPRSGLTRLVMDHGLDESRVRGALNWHSKALRVPGG